MANWYHDVRVRNRGRLPHWERAGGLTFVTFRLADALPAEVVRHLLAERNQRMAAQERAGQTPAELAKTQESYAERLHTLLDAGRGSCALGKTDIATMMAGVLRHFHTKRYRLDTWCVMPNHVHVLFAPLPGNDLPRILHGWKSYSAHEANRLLGRDGPFWLDEYYDHLVRDEEEGARIREYILKNPVRAGLRDWNWARCELGAEVKE